MDIRKFNKLLYLLAGVIFIVTGLVGDNKTFIPVGSVFLILSLAYGRNRKGGDEE